MRNKAIIFDMDGVIIDSEGFWRQAQKAALAGWGKTITDEACVTLTKGKRLDDIAQFWCKYCQLKIDPMLLAIAIRARMVELIETQGEGMEGIERLLTFYCQTGHRIALATSSSHIIIDAVLTRLGLWGYFDVICSADDEPYGKPHPAVYFSALRQLSLPAASCTVIEDSLNGFNAARGAGIKTIVVSDACQHDGFDGAAARYVSLNGLLEDLEHAVEEVE